MKTYRKGFTIIEMLVVIAIIGILATLVLVGLGPVQKQARDARRISDLKEVQTGLELYYNKCGFYPGPTSGGTPCAAYAPNNTWVGMAAAITGSNLGILQVPNDPSAGASYNYGASATGNSYVIGAQLEDANNPALRLSSPIVATYGVACNAPAFFCIQL